ncbi:MAG: NAD(P)H-binding protein, partial [Pirellulales bacterium]|nr:NAD(P)H-binding protein [Pirellulales bacterium]
MLLNQHQKRMSSTVPSKKCIILLTGATGYVGGRLLPLLEGKGYQVRCLTRRPEALQETVGAETEVVKGDVLDVGSLTAAMAQVDTAFY